MVIPNYFLISRLLKSRVLEDDAVLRLIANSENILENTSCILVEPRIISRISKFYDNFEISSLEQVYFGESNAQGI